MVTRLNSSTVINNYKPLKQNKLIGEFYLLAIGLLISVLATSTNTVPMDMKQKDEKQKKIENAILKRVLFNTLVALF